MPRVTYNATCQEISYHICLLTKTKLSFYEPKMPARAPLVAAQGNQQPSITGFLTGPNQPPSRARNLTMHERLMVVWLARYAPRRRRKTCTQLEGIYKKGNTCITNTLKKQARWENEAARLIIKFQVDGTSYSSMSDASDAAVKVVHHGVRNSMTIIAAETVTSTATSTSAVAPSLIDSRTPNTTRNPGLTLPKLDLYDKIEIYYQHQHIRKTRAQLVQEWNSSESHINRIVQPDSITKNLKIFHDHLYIVGLSVKGKTMQDIMMTRGVTFSENAIAKIIDPATILKINQTAANILRHTV